MDIIKTERLSNGLDISLMFWDSIRNDEPNYRGMYSVQVSLKDDIIEEDGYYTNKITGFQLFKEIKEEYITKED